MQRYAQILQLILKDVEQTERIDFMILVMVMMLILVMMEDDTLCRREVLRKSKVLPGVDVDGGDDDVGGGYDGRDSIYHFRSCVTAHPTCFIQMTTGGGKYILTILYF